LTARKAALYELRMPPLPMTPPTPGGPLPGKAQLPGNPMGGPAGPGAPPMTSPGAGAGNEAATDAMVAGVMQTLYKALQAYPLGSKKNGAVLNAIRALSANFSKQETNQLVPSAIQQMALAAKPQGPLANAPMPPLSLAPPPGMGAGGPPPGGLGGLGGPPGGGEEEM
jgi:hypothetical protein